MACSSGPERRVASTAGRYIVALHERGERLKRRQDLPDEAFWSVDELAQTAQRLGDRYGLLFVALSYRWLSKEHPDPEGFQLRIVAEVAKLYMHEDG